MFAYLHNAPRDYPKVDWVEYSTHKVASLSIPHIPASRICRAGNGIAGVAGSQAIEGNDYICVLCGARTCRQVGTYWFDTDTRPHFHLCATQWTHFCIECRESARDIVRAKESLYVYMYVMGGPARVTRIRIPLGERTAIEQIVEHREGRAWPVLSSPGGGVFAVVKDKLWRYDGVEKAAPASMFEIIDEQSYVFMRDNNTICVIPRNHPRVLLADVRVEAVHPTHIGNMEYYSSRHRAAFVTENVYYLLFDRSRKFTIHAFDIRGSADAEIYSDVTTATDIV